MCKASKLLNETKGLVESIKREQDLLNKASSKYDKELSVLYHKLESSSKMNAVDGWYFSKQIQEVLRKRRLVKIERDRVQALSFGLNITSMDESIDKTTKNIDRLKRKNDKYISNWNMKIEDFEQEFVTQ